MSRSSSLVLALTLVSVLASPGAAESTRPRVLTAVELRSATEEVSIPPDYATCVEREVLRTRSDSTAQRPEGAPELWLTLRYDDGAEERYALHGKSRLYDETRGLTHRFYMGYSLRERLAATGRATRVPPPASPARPASPATAPPAPPPEVPVEAILQGVGVDVEVSLDAADRLELAFELGRADRFAAPGSPRDGLLVAPSWKLLVRYADGREERYGLYSRSVLHDERTNLTCQFFMGFLLEEIAARVQGR